MVAFVWPLQSTALSVAKHDNRSGKLAVPIPLLQYRTIGVREVGYDPDHPRVESVSEACRKKLG